MTDGMLLRETMLDPLLTKVTARYNAGKANSCTNTQYSSRSQYSVVMVDEAHERSVYTDVLLGLLKKIQKRRKDLRLVISSATLDAEIFKRYFNANKTNDPSKDTAAIMSIEGRTFPVDVHYLKTPTTDYLLVHKLQLK